MTAFEKGSITLILLLSVAVLCFSQSADQRQAGFAAHVRKAQEYRGEKREGNNNGAVAQFRQAIAIDPHVPGAHFELAELFHTSEDPAVKKEAEQEYHAALVDNPQDEKLILRLAEIDAEREYPSFPSMNTPKLSSCSPAMRMPNWDWPER